MKLSDATNSTSSASAGIAASPKAVKTAYDLANGKMAAKPASIELYPSSSANHGGFIDFHWNGSTADYTSRIIESASGRIAITASNRLYLNGTAINAGASSATAYITTTWRSGPNWYRKYSDGWIEQGGALGAVPEDSTYTQNLHTPFSDSDYMALLTQVGGSMTEFTNGVSVWERTTTSITVRQWNYANIYFWYACGY